jgi:colanic acid/amylovoran biosynthesis protein
MYRPGLVRRGARRFLRRLDPFVPLSRLQGWAARRATQRLALEFLLPRTARANLEEMRSADLIVSTGGTYLVEHYALEEKFLQLALAAASGKPLILFTQSLGPFRNAGNVRRLRRLLPHFRLTLLRDERSLRHLRELDAPANGPIRVVADAAFVLADPGSWRRPGQADRKRGLRVGFSVRDWLFPGHDSPAAAQQAYLESVAAAVEHLVRDCGAEVSFLSTCQGVPDYPFDDSAVARQIVGSLPDDVAARVTVDAGFHGPEELIGRLGGFDFVAATRMHMAILSLCVGTPVLAIAYEFKTRELFANMGLGDWVLDIDALTPSSICGRMDAFMAALDGISRLLPEVVERQRQSALSVVDDLCAITCAGVQQETADARPVLAEPAR